MTARPTPDLRRKGEVIADANVLWQRGLDIVRRELRERRESNAVARRGEREHGEAS